MVIGRGDPSLSAPRRPSGGGAERGPANRHDGVRVALRAAARRAQPAQLRPDLGLGGDEDGGLLALQLRCAPHERPGVLGQRGQRPEQRDGAVPCVLLRLEMAAWTYYVWGALILMGGAVLYVIDTAASTRVDEAVEAAATARKAYEEAARGGVTPP